MPAVVLIVFCILHYDVRPMGNVKVTDATPSSLSSGSGIPSE